MIKQKYINVRSKVHPDVETHIPALKIYNTALLGETIRTYVTPVITVTVNYRFT